jgi:hypothetical protein
MPNVVLWNIGFQWMRIVFLMYLHAKNHILMNTVLIHEHSCTDPHLPSQSEKMVETLRKEQVRTCNNAVLLLMLLSHRLSSCCLWADLCIDWSFTKSRTWLSRQLNWKKKTIISSKCFQNFKKKICAFYVCQLYIILSFQSFCLKA